MVKIKENLRIDISIYKWDTSFKKWIYELKGGTHVAIKIRQSHEKITFYRCVDFFILSKEINFEPIRKIFDVYLNNSDGLIYNLLKNYHIQESLISLKHEYNQLLSQKENLRNQKKQQLPVYHQLIQKINSIKRNHEHYRNVYRFYNCGSENSINQMIKNTELHNIIHEFRQNLSNKKSKDNQNLSDISPCCELCGKKENWSLKIKKDIKHPDCIEIKIESNLEIQHIILKEWIWDIVPASIMHSFCNLMLLCRECHNQAYRVLYELFKSISLSEIFIHDYPFFD